MKTKIFALIISILCLSMIFVACAQECTEHVDANNDGVCDNCEVIVEKETGTEEEAETLAPCEIHKDADADKTCDACGRAVVAIVEYVTEEQETRKEMVVNPIPETSATDYLDTAFKGNQFLSSSNSIKVKGTVSGANGVYLYTRDYDAFTDNTTHCVIDLSTVDAETGDFKVLWQGVSNSSMGQEYSVNMNNYFFVVKKTTNDFNGSQLACQAYSYTGEAFGNAWASSEEDPYYEEPQYNYELNRDGALEVYYNYYGTTYVFDKATYELIYSESTSTIDARPIMDTVVGDYGYLLSTNGNFYIYDLTKWREVYYLYKVESKYENLNYFVLDNGNVLMTAFVHLPNESVSFDCIEDGEKYDMVYFVIDVAANTITPVEFGYYISSLTPAGEGYTDAAAGLYVANVYPVFEGYVNSNAPMTLLVDSDLKIVCKVETLGYPVADGLYVKEEEFFNGNYTWELVDATGNHVDYLDSVDLNGHIVSDNKCYTYRGELLVDLNEYNLIEDNYYNYYGYNYYVLTKTVQNPEDGTVDEKYLYVFGSAPIKLPKNDDETNNYNWSISYADNHYRVSYTTSNGQYFTKFYSLNGTYLLTIEDRVSSVRTYENLTVVYTSSGSCYVLK